MATGTLTSKGQITIPKQIRDRLSLETGRRVEFNVDSKGNVILTPRNKDFRSLKGIVRSRKRTRAVSVKEMNEAIAEGFSKP
ncbi:MAG TPA: AbrB/MazE/SpoVT family DNA-binding domain-containing protein [Bryobacteraceae bacterium]|nr:AbrB/MazE/SpoVT family DNA-binding domain-containing protein [Bryobacteraceae bacterium]